MSLQSSVLIYGTATCQFFEIYYYKQFKTIMPLLLPLSSLHPSPSMVLTHQTSSPSAAATHCLLPPQTPLHQIHRHLIIASTPPLCSQSRWYLRLVGGCRWPPQGEQWHRGPGRQVYNGFKAARFGVGKVASDQ